MLRLFSNAFRPRIFAAVAKNVTENIPRVFTDIQTSNFSTLTHKPPSNLCNNQNVCCGIYKSVLLNPQFNELQAPPSRNLTKFSRKKGKRKSVKTVVKRFYRLNWGMWIRTMAGRHKKLWKKGKKQRQQLRRHVTTTATQSRLLDKMVTSFWRKPKYYVDDPYEPYHSREEFYITRRKPLER